MSQLKKTQEWRQEPVSGTTHLHAQGGHPHRDCGTVPVTEQGYQSLRGGSMTPGDEG